MMKDYKILMIGILLLILIVLILLCAWLWSHNRKYINPVPVIADTSSNELSAKDSETIYNASVHIQADKALERILNDLIVHFESRYPSIQVTVDYMTKAALFSVQTNDADSKDYLVDTDIIMTNNSLAEVQIEHLQNIVNQAQDHRNQ